MSDRIKLAERDKEFLLNEIERLTAANKNLGKQLQDVEMALNSQTSAENTRLREALEPLVQSIEEQLHKQDAWHQFEFFSPTLDMYLVIQARKALKDKADE